MDDTGANANRPRTKSARRASLGAAFGNHNRAWIWGRHAVLETLRAGRWQPLELAISDRLTPRMAAEVQQTAAHAALKLQVLNDAALTLLCRASDHQGLAARMPPFPYADATALLTQQPALTSWLILDRLQDGFNFGAILRSASAFGIDAVIVGEREQAPVNSQVVRSSAGAVNHLPIAQVATLIEFTRALRQQGVQVLAASEKATAALAEQDLTRPVAIVIGNEGQGVARDLLALATTPVRIPMTGRVGSLNAAVAAGIVCYEVARQRGVTVAAADAGAVARPRA